MWRVVRERGDEMVRVLLFPAVRERVMFNEVVEARSVYGFEFMVMVCSDGLELAKLRVAV